MEKSVLFCMALLPQSLVFLFCIYFLERKYLIPFKKLVKIYSLQLRFRVLSNSGG